MFKKRTQNEKVIRLLEEEMESLRELMREAKKAMEACYPHDPNLAEHYQARYEVHRLKLHQTERIWSEVQKLK